MSTLNVNTVEPAGATLTIGESGDTVKANDSVNVNTVKDAGGNTIWVSDGSGNLSSVDSAFGDALVLLSTQTASDDASISFTSDIDSTYKEYIFKFINMNPATDGGDWQWQAGSTYNETITSSAFLAQLEEDHTGAGLSYRTSYDQAEGTAFQWLTASVGNASDESASGELHIFNPASTTYVKNFYSRVHSYSNADTGYSEDMFIAGYLNTTSAITQVQFKFDSGNINEGTIKMYGVK